MITYVTDDPAIVEAAREQHLVFEAFKDMLESIRPLLGFHHVRWVQQSDGTEVRIVGARSDDPMPPLGWHYVDSGHEGVERYLAPEAGTHAGSAAAQLLHELGPVPSPRSLLERFGMPDAVAFDAGDGPRIYRPGVRPLLGKILVEWPVNIEEVVTIDHDIWKRAA